MGNEKRRGGEEKKRGEVSRFKIENQKDNPNIKINEVEEEKDDERRVGDKRVEKECENMMMN